VAGQGAQRHRTWVFAAAGVGGAAIIVVVIVLLIANRSSHAPIAGGQPGSGVVGTPTAVGGTASEATRAIVGGTTASPSAMASGSPAATAHTGTGAGGAGQSTARSAPSSSRGSSAPDTSPLASVAICTSADFDTRANACRKVGSQVSSGNGGQTVDGDLSFPDYMTGTISLLQKKGTTWQKLGEFSTKTYPDVVVIDSNKFISVQLANVFSYGGHRALPKCSTDWGIEVDDAQGLPLGDVMFRYECK
jgi:hypothetical protein